MKTNVLSEIRHARAETEKAASLRARAQKEARLAEQRAQQAEAKMQRFLVQELPKAVGFSNVVDLVAAIQTAVASNGHSEPAPTARPPKQKMRRTRKQKAVIAEKPAAKQKKTTAAPAASPTGGKNTKITKELLRQVKTLNKAGKTDVEIANEIGVKPATIKYARKKLKLKGIAGNPINRKKMEMAA